MKDLEGKVAIVTGAARGTGAAVARRLVELGSHVLLGDVLHEAGEKTAAELGERARFVPHDVTKADEWERIVESALAERGRVDVLVNNAAVLHLGTIEHTPEEALRRLLDVNTVGPFLGIRAVLAPMRAQGGGAIVNVGSLDSLTGMNGITAYCTSKWGLRGLAKAAALELGRAGIRVNSVCPAGGNPEMYGPWMQQMVGFMEETQAYMENRALPGQAPLEAIAEAVAFLASDASGHCTGVDLPVDGGAHAGGFLPGFNTL
ncbi:MAG: SDR family oxidoreductase [Myxococcota bacterium]|nr:SDR family oxidoreductase [Myxococcota bacterium]